MRDPGTDEPEVTLGGADHIGDVAGVSNFDGGLDCGMEGNEGGKEAGENELAGDGACSQGETATDLAGEVFELLIEVGAGGEDSGCETLKLSPGAGHDDAAFPSVEKRYSYIILQPSDLLADAGLGEAEMLGSARERATFDHFQVGCHVIDVH